MVRNRVDSMAASATDAFPDWRGSTGETETEMGKKDRLGMGLINPKRYWLEKVSVEAAEVTTFWWNSGVQFCGECFFALFLTRF